MFHWKSASLVIFILFVAIFLTAENPAKNIHRDGDAIEILTRAVAAAGGLQALSNVRDLTESGEVTFHWGEGHTGAVTIQALGGDRFRMEADLPEGKRTWAVRAGVGSVKEPKGRVHAISGDNAINLENLTFPAAHIVAVLTDSTSDVSFVGIEKQSGRSIYRIRVTGRLGLGSTSAGPRITVAKDLMVDALNFNIVGVEDHLIRRYERDRIPSDKPSRVIEFEDFRKVDGVLVPFSITTRLMGQKTFSIRLSSVEFNRNLIDRDFQN
jgi:hypothetical protein